MNGTVSDTSPAFAAGLGNMAATMARHCKDIDWTGWSPAMRATLLFVIRDGHVLLMRKKRGLGAGKINAPGGKVDPGETTVECAVRETEEELLIRALDPVWVGLLRFQFTDGLSIHCDVFRATEFSGTPTETAEGAPLWFPLNEIPFAEMWKDDAVWMPLLLAGKTFQGNFIFEGDEMLDYLLV